MLACYSFLVLSRLGYRRNVYLVNRIAVVLQANVTIGRAILFVASDCLGFNGFAVGCPDSKSGQL